MPLHLADNYKIHEMCSLVDVGKMQKMKETDPDIESQIMSNVQSFASSLILSKHTKSHPKTIQAKLRLLAFTVIVYKRFMNNFAMSELDKAMACQVGRAHCRPLYFATKYKYDEMSMNISSKQAGESLNATTTKLLQLSVAYLCVWKINEKYVKMITHMPTSLLSIEKNNSACLTEALSRQVQTPPAAQRLFSDRASVAIADDHGANGITDSALGALGVTDIESKWKCRTHKVQKLADVIVQRYKNEKRGLMHTVLSFGFAGQFKEFRSNMKVILKHRLRVMPYGEDGAGKAANDHREAVFKPFCNVHDLDKLGERSELPTKLVTEYHVQRKLHNGNFKRKDIFEHYCPGPWCCASPEDTYNQLCTDWIDGLSAPTPWRCDDWQGFAPAIDCVGYLLSAHDIFTPAFLSTFPPKLSKSVSAAGAGNAHDEEEGDDNHDDPDFKVEYEAEMPEPVKDCTLFERQNTYRANARTWLDTKPLARLWSLRSIVREQMGIHISIFSQVGSGWDDQEARRRARGEQPRYRVLMLRSGVHFEKAFQTWGKLATDPKSWIGLPAAFHHHDLAVSTFRACAAASAAAFQLLQVPCEQSGVEEFELLEAPGFAAQRRCSERLSSRFIRKPCLSEHWWAEHHRLHPSVDALLSADSMAKIDAQADFVEIDNVNIETANANTRKFVMTACQQKAKAIEDVSAAKVVGEAKAEDGSLWNDAWEYDNTSADTPCQKGGGGVFRGFVSHHAPNHRLQSGKTDFKTICSLWREEKSKLEESELMRQCRARGIVATEAHRNNFDQNGKKVMTSTSAFGKVHTKDVKSAQIKARNQTEVDDFKRCLANAKDDQHALIVQDARHAFCQQLLAKHSGDLRGQILAIYRVARLLGPERRKADAADAIRVRQKLRQEHAFAGVNFADIKLPPYDVPLRVAMCDALPNTITVKPDMRTVEFAARRVSQISDTRGKLRLPALALWEKEHYLIKSAECEPVHDTPQGFRATYCSEFGHGRCLCSDGGFVLNLAKRKFAASIARACPKGSEMRSLIQGSWLIVEVESNIYNIAMFYFRPRRPTFVRMVLEPGLAWGRQTVKPVFKPGTTTMHCISEVDAVESWSLDGPLSYKLYRLVSLASLIEDFAPSAKLCIEELGPNLIENNPCQFWNGAQAELDAWREQQRKARDRAARKRMQQDNNEGPRAKKARTERFGAKAVRRPLPQAQGDMVALEDGDVEDDLADDQMLEGEVEREKTTTKRKPMSTRFSSTTTWRMPRLTRRKRWCKQRRNLTISRTIRYQVVIQ